MMLLMWTSLSFALDLSAISAGWEASEELTVDSARSVENETLTIGPVTWTLSQGDLHPIRMEDATLGFIFLGEGTMTVSMATTGDAHYLGNHLAQRARADPEALTDLSGEAPTWTTPITRGWVLSDLTSVHTLIERQPAAAEEGRLKDAVRLMEKRSRQHQSLGGDPRHPARLDQLVGQANGRVFADFDTGRSLKLEGANHGSGWDQDAWLTLVSDPEGYRTLNSQYLLLASGRMMGDRARRMTVTSTPFPQLDPSDPASPPTAPLRILPRHALTTTEATPTRNGLYIDVDIEAELTLSTAGGSLPWFGLDLPRVEAQDRQFSLGKLRLLGADGAEIELLALHDQAEQQDASSLLLVPARALSPDEEVRLIVDWHDSWPMSSPNQITGQSMGKSSDLQSVIPYLSPGGVGNPWPFVHRLGVPVDSELSISISGASSRSWEEDGRRWEEATHTHSAAMWPDVAIGEWVNLTAPAPPNTNLPALRLHLFPEEAETIASFPNEIWRIIQYYEQLLPQFPYTELELFQSPDMLYGYVWIAPHAMVSLRKAQVIDGDESYFRNDTPYLEQGVLAHEIAHQYWGHTSRPASLYDFWIAETFSEIYACLYVAAVYDPEACTTRMASWQEKWQEDLALHNASLTRAYESAYQSMIVYNYGPFLFNGLLRTRIGDDAFFRAMDVVMQLNPEQQVTTSELQTIFSAVTDPDVVERFFDYWVHGGFIPALQLSWRLVETDAGQVVEGEVSSDIPFGALDVPVRIAAVDGARQTLWVTLQDGRGAFQSEPLSQEQVTVLLDPDELLLARSRRVKKE